MLESRTFFRVGGTQPIKVDVRVIAATNRSLRDAVTLGEFRDDLYYRLSVLNIYLPPLRERREDIPLLVRRFIRELAREHDRTFRGIAPEALERLVNAPWPGNVRQLRNLIESMVVLAPGAEIRAADIPLDVLEGPGSLLPVRIGSVTGRRRRQGRARVGVHPPEPARPQAPGGGAAPPAGRGSPAGPGDRGGRPRQPGRGGLRRRPATAGGRWSTRAGMTMADVERAAIEAALHEHRGNRRQAAEVLGIGERTLYRKIKAYHLE